MKKLLIVVIIFLVSSAGSWAGAEESGQRSRASLGKTLGSPTWTRFNINYLSTTVNVIGLTDVSTISQGGLWGMLYPKGSGKGTVAASGLIWGAHAGIGGDLRIGGSVWYSFLEPGRILDTMKPESSDLPKNRIYRVRRDIPPGNKTADISSEINDGEGSATTIYDQYEKDWNEWPWQDGAPYDDKNGNGIYEPLIDVPGIPGADQTIWGVARDIPNTQLFGTPPLGIELQTTVWGYRSEGALGHMLFRRYVLINRNTIPFDSMYVAMWADPDLGNAGDDLAGCDTTRSLGFVYNGQETDKLYSPLPPPAVGFDFFQGPLVQGAPTDSAIFKGKRVYGKRNLPMTGFFVNTNGAVDPVLVDPFQYGGIYGATQMYRALQGFVGYTGDPYIDPATGTPTKFPFSGDPQNRTGWLDGTHGLTFGDRRMGITSGPFRMMPGDTQEVVVAEICAGAIPGCDRLSAIGLLKYYDDQAQAAYDNLFAVPRSPYPPRVAASPLDREIILNWGDDSASIAATEVPSPIGYAFEGYNIYQLPSRSAAVADAKRLATFDVVNGIGKILDKEFDPAQGTVLTKVEEYGSDSGIQRWFRITGDRLRNDTPLINGNPYYYAVTAYNYNPAPGAVPATLETPMSILTVLPHSPDPGTRLHAATGQTLQVTHSAGISTAVPSVKVIDPAHLHPSDYEIRVTVTDSVFNNDLGANVANPKWSVYDVTNGKTMSTPSTYYSVDGSNVTLGGLQIGIGGSPFYVYGKELFSAAWVPPSHFNITGVNFGSGNPGDVSYTLGIYVGNEFFGLGLLNSSQVNTSVLFEFVGKGQGQNAYDFPRIATGSTGSLYQGFYPQPFNVWELNADGTKKRQLDFLFMEKTGTAYYDSIWAPGAAGTDREYWFVVAETYTSTPKAKYVAGVTTLGTALGEDSVAWSGWHILTNAANPAYYPGDTWTLLATNIVTARDAWTFSATTLAPTTSVVDARADVTSINVFPNPYYGVNPQEINKYQRFITFSHLPRRAVIRIFNLAGVMVRKIVRENDSQFEQWDLKNDSGLPVGSGLYIAYVEMPDLGVTKVLKIALVQEQQILDKY